MENAGHGEIYLNPSCGKTEGGHMCVLGSSGPARLAYVLKFHINKTPITAKMEDA